MITTIIIGVLLLVGFAVLIFGPRVDGESIRIFSAVPLGIAFIMLVFSTTAIIQAKNVGVVTSFGRPTGTESSGLAWKWPWQKVTEIDGTVDTNEYRGDDGCIYVRIGDGSRSCVTATIRWRIIPDKADTIYADYRSDDPTESFRRAVISTQFKSAVQAVLSEYNPVAELEVVEGSNAASASQLSFAPDYDQISADLEAQMQERLGDDPQAEVVDITVSYVSLAGSTQKTIDDFISEVGRTRNAAQARNTAVEQAAANRTIQESLQNNSEGVLASRCIDAFESAIEKGYALPAGFNCLGAGSSVVVPATR